MSYETPKNEKEVDALGAVRKLTKALARRQATASDHVTGGEELDGRAFVLYAYCFGLQVMAPPSDDPGRPKEDTAYLAEVAAEARKREEEGQAEPFPRLLYVGAMPLGSVEPLEGAEEPYARAFEVPLPSGNGDDADHGPTPIDMLNELIAGKTPKSIMTNDMKMEAVGSFSLEGLSTHQIATMMGYSEGHTRRLRREWRKKLGEEYLCQANAGRIGLLAEVYERSARAIVDALGSADLSPIERAELAQSYMKLALDFGKVLGVRG